jgi:sugar/nucleoside kinase (ribokinase family)
MIHDTLVQPANDAPWGTTTLVDTIDRYPGGNGANTSLALARIGASVRLLGVAGEDEAGRYLLDELAQAGVDTRFIKVAGTPTPATVVLVDQNGDRRFFHRLGIAADAFARPIDFTPELLGGMRHYHLASLFILPRLRANAPETLARARRAGLTTSLDTNWDPLGRWMEDLRPCLSHLDFLFLNEDEARMATGETDPAAAARAFQKAGASCVVIKLGARGCAVYSNTGAIHSPAYAVPVRDTTGAGDCFVAGFLSAAIEGRDMAECASYANAVGALSVQVVGGAVGIVPGIDVDAWRTSGLKRIP